MNDTEINAPDRKNHAKISPRTMRKFWTIPELEMGGTIPTAPITSNPIGYFFIWAVGNPPS
jgi:hypothetical protein